MYNILENIFDFTNAILYINLYFLIEYQTKQKRETISDVMEVFLLITILLKGL